jgi:hypothetical protein
MTKEHDRVILVASLPEHGFKPGDVGTVVHLYEDGGYLADMPDLEA